VLDALAALRLAGRERPLVLGAPDAAPYAAPGGHAARWLLQAGVDVRAAARWQDAVDGAAALVVTDGTDGTGHVLRAALATGLPVVVVAGPLVADHLRACGARCVVAQPRAAPLAEALAAALDGSRARRLGEAARAAVLAESSEPAARALVGRSAPPVPRRPRVHDPRALRVTVVNPAPSGGGGERFLHRLVPSLAAEGLDVRLVVPLAPGRAFALAADELVGAGVDVQTPPAQRLDEVVADLSRESDLVYYAWPHLAEAPEVASPLACTFHDANWRHFFTYAPEERAAADRQTADWIARCARIVCSSRFIRGELVDGFGAPGGNVAVVPLTAEAPAAVEDAARAAVRARHALPERFLLSPHGHHAHKNYAVLVAALARLRAAGSPVQVIATGAGTEAFHGPDLVGLGYVSGEELAVLYDLALGMVQTTLYEAGSFPLWEAMLARMPAACSDIPPLREQLERQGTRARLFAPLDAADVAAALDELWTRQADPAVLDANARAVGARTWADVAADYARELRKAAGAGR
jgi:alpha-1,3-rhamnosyl/mannosyltransferase